MTEIEQKPVETRPEYESRKRVMSKALHLCGQWTKEARDDILKAGQLLGKDGRIASPSIAGAQALIIKSMGTLDEVINATEPAKREFKRRRDDPDLSDDDFVNGLYLSPDIAMS